MPSPIKLAAREGRGKYEFCWGWELSAALFSALLWRKIHPLEVSPNTNILYIPLAHFADALSSHQHPSKAVGGLKRILLAVEVEGLKRILLAVDT